MPRDGNNVYSKPANTTAVTGQTITASIWNTMIDDLVADANLDRPIAAGGTGASTADAARTNLNAAVKDGSETLTGAKTFSGNVIVPNSTTGTHALNVTTADERYISTTGSTAVTYTGAFNVTREVSVGDVTQSIILDVKNGKGALYGTKIDTESPINSRVSGVTFNTSDPSATLIFYGNTMTFTSAEPENTALTGGSQTIFARLAISGETASYTTPTDIATKSKADAAYAAASSSLRFKDDAFPAPRYVTVEDLGDLCAWVWGGELPPDDHRFGRDGWGLIAEHVVDVLPEAAVFDPAGDLTGLQALPLIALLVQELRAVKERVANLEAAR